ncbi:MAG: DUF4339 domain-containing protein, partial [Alphaproteobacteria bacterium]|nr:DUF4339 domain-containing protein [Alphaproteobacteria bacterium]
MNVMKSDDPWFIARDGHQHGPLSDTEMKLFVERGHLRATDLIWRQGFPDWRPAQSVFPAKPQPDPQTAPGQAATAQQGYPASGGPDQATFSNAPSSQAAPNAGSNNGQFDAAQSVGGGVATISDEATYDEDDAPSPRWGRAIASTLIIGTVAGMGLWFYVHGPPSLFDQAATGGTAVPVVKAPDTTD